MNCARCGRPIAAAEGDAFVGIHRLACDRVSCNPKPACSIVCASMLQIDGFCARVTAETFGANDAQQGTGA
jgi:hypothetical protein